MNLENTIYTSHKKNERWSTLLSSSWLELLIVWNRMSTWRHRLFARRGSVRLLRMSFHRGWNSWFVLVQEHMSSIGFHRESSLQVAIREIRLLDPVWPHRERGWKCFIRQRGIWSQFMKLSIWQNKHALQYR